MTCFPEYLCFILPDEVWRPRQSRPQQVHQGVAEVGGLKIIKFSHVV